VTARVGHERLETRDVQGCLGRHLEATGWRKRAAVREEIHPSAVPVREPMRHRGRCEPEGLEVTLHALEVSERFDENGDVDVLGHAPRCHVEQQFGNECSDDAELHLQRAQAARQVAQDAGDELVSACHHLPPPARGFPPPRAPARCLDTGAGGSMTRRFPARAAGCATSRLSTSRSSNAAIGA